MRNLPIPFAVLAIASATLPPAAGAQQRDTTVVAGPQYGRGPLYRLIFGTDYRSLWTAPVRAPILDLRSYAGGLTPTTVGGGFQTASLYFEGADGYHYQVRGVDKLPGVLPDEIDSTFVRSLVFDQTRSSQPGSAGVASALLDATDVLHVDEELVVVPDDPALDSNRARFRGMLAFFNRRAVADTVSGHGFHDARQIVSSCTLFPSLRASAADRVDSRAFLAARLMDLYMGDWDRHRAQWRWVRFAGGRPTRWVPLPEDRDQAFARFDGWLLAVTRATSAPFLVKFDDHYANLVGQTWNGRDLDRWLLAELDRTVWDSVAHALQSRLTDSVIVGAVHHLPDAWYALDGVRLTTQLLRRRDALVDEAARYYELLARDADVRATDADDDASAERLADGTLRVQVARRGEAGAPWFTRTFDPRETDEVRIYLRQGADRFALRGDGPERIAVRVIADSQSAVVDSSRAGGLKRYDAGWMPDTVRRKPRRIGPIPTRPCPTDSLNPIPARDWGSRVRPLAWVSYGPDAGVFLGAGATITTYGFRKLPFASQWRLRGGIATGASEGRASIDGVIRRAESNVRTEIGALASGIEVIRWNGHGNATTITRPIDYYRVQQAQVDLHARMVFPIGWGALAIGPTLQYSHTRPQAGRIIADSLPFGSSNFGQVGLRTAFDLDTRDNPAAATRGVRLNLSVAGYPKAWSVPTAFVEAEAVGSTYFTADHFPGRPTLALRAGARRVTAGYPFFQAAFLGDASTVRLGVKNRYAGDAAVWGNAELRFALTRYFIIVPGEMGIFALADAGRVYLKGETSNTLHRAIGGGVWVTLLGPATVLSVAVARSDDRRTAVYFGAGFAY